MTDQETDRAAARVLAACAAILALAVGLSPVLPCIDLPQHVALATILRRVWDGDPDATATYAVNLATHNGGVHLLLAAASYVMPITLATRLLVAVYPPLLLGGVASLARAAGVPPWRALFVVPAVLGYSFAWGFANFCLASAMALFALSLLVRQLDAPTWRRAAMLAVLSLALGVTHVMAMLLCACVAAGIGVERALRGERSIRALGRIALAGAPLLAGCAYDLAVLAAHLAAAPASYTSAPDGFDAFSPLRKVGFLGTFVAGLWGTYADTALAWVTIAALASVAVSTTWARATGPSRGLVAPFVVATLGYFLVPSVFLNTHLVFQRLAQWMVVGAALALPALAPAWEARARRIAIGLATIATGLAVLHLAYFATEVRDLPAALALVPKGARVTGYVERTRTTAVRVGALTHAAAMAVPLGAADDAFSFGRFLSMPIAYRKDGTVPAPVPSWEHGLSPYQPASALARRFPILLVRPAWDGEATTTLATRLFAERRDRVRTLGRSGGWVVFDTSGYDTPSR